MAGINNDGSFREAGKSLKLTDSEYSQYNIQRNEKGSSPIWIPGKYFII